MGTSDLQPRWTEVMVPEEGGAVFWEWALNLVHTPPLRAAAQVRSPCPSASLWSRGLGGPLFPPGASTGPTLLRPWGSLSGPGA